MKRVLIKKAVGKTRKQKDMSVSELAGMVARGFTEIHTDFKERFDGIDGRFNILDHKVDRIQDSVNELSYESRKTRTRIENLELKVFGSVQEA